MSGCLESGIACISRQLDEPANSLREYAQNTKRSARSLIKRPRTFQGGFYSSSRFHDTQTKFKYEPRRELLIPNSDLVSEQESVHDPTSERQFFIMSFAVWTSVNDEHVIHRAYSAINRWLHFAMPHTHAFK